MTIWNSSHLAPLHDKLVAAGVPLLSVRLKAGSIELEFADEATDEQKADAQKIVDAYDPDAEEAAPSIIDEINNAKTLPQLKEALIKHYNLKG